MNIGVVTTWFERGASYVSRQFEKVLSRSHEVFIYARGGEKYAIGDPNWDRENVTWGKRSLLSTTTSVNIDHFQAWIKENKIDVVIFNEQHEWQPVIACYDLKVICGSYVDYYKKETVPLFSAYDFLICNTRRHYSVFDSHPQSIYVPWGTDINLYIPNPLNQKNSEMVTFFHSCGMNPYRKGTDLFLKAFDMIKERNVNSIIHSQVDLKGFFPDLKDMIGRLISDKSLKVINETVSAPGLYHLGDVYVYPSRLDGIGLTIAEALSCGLPAIVTDQQPMNEFVEDYVSGRLVKIEKEQFRSDNYFWPQSIVEVEDLASKMEFYVKKKHDLPFLKQKSRDYACQYLDWKKNSQYLSENLGKLKFIDDVKKRDGIKYAIEYQKRESFLSWVKRTRGYAIVRKNLKYFFE